MLALVQLFGQSLNRRQYLDALVRLIRAWSGIRRVGIRVMDQDGYIPYDSQDGFDAQFIEKENWLSIKDDECACLRIARGQREAIDEAALTPEGSFCTGDSAEFISGVTEADLCRFRGTCVREGFASLAIIPVRCRRDIVAVIHLADKRQGIVKGGIVELLETVSPIIGDAIQRFTLESEIAHRLDMEAAMSSLLRLSLEHVSTEELARTTEELLEGMAWLPYRKVSVRLGNAVNGVAAGAATDTDTVHRIPVRSDGVTLGSLELAVKPGQRWGSREQRFLESVANLLAGILTRKHAEDQLLRAQRMEMAGKVAAQVAHDLNNLLTPLLGYSQLIARSLPPDHPASAHGQRLLQAARQVSAINGDLLALGRRGRVQVEPVDMNILATQVLDRLPEDLPELVVRTNLRADLPNISGSPSQLIRVIANLVTNARDAMEDKGTLMVSTALVHLEGSLSRHPGVAPGEYVELEVSDTGCGIPAGIVEAIFDPFFSTKRADEKRGSGLGLSIVQSIIEDHGGYLDLESREGEGTVFRVYLPAVGYAPRLEEGPDIP